MFKIKSVSVEERTVTGQSGIRYLTVTNPTPRITWKLLSSEQGTQQKSFRLVVDDGHVVFWDSPEFFTCDQFIIYNGSRLEPLKHYNLRLYVTDSFGNEAVSRGEFYLFPADIDLPWITSEAVKPRNVVRFGKTIVPKDEVAEAYAIYSGIGYCTLMADGEYIQEARLDPAFSDYSETCYYVAEDISGIFKPSVPCEIKFEVADGWRYYDSPFITGVLGARPRFDGTKQLSAMVHIAYRNGDVEELVTGEDWFCDDSSPITEASLYDGETYDATEKPSHIYSVKLCDKPCKKSLMMNIPPIVTQEIYKPVSVWNIGDETIIDFGQNIAGVLSIAVPAEAECGTVITVKHAEELDEDGHLFTEPLRQAVCTDKFICSGAPQQWMPRYTFHGFRYVSISGIKVLPGDDIKAVALRTDLELQGDFTCGSAILSKIHDICVATEKDNIHSIMSDCPQRDERMGWMNDATVRFQTTPYNFDIRNMFCKVADDIIDAQDENGAITCTAPFIVGGRPADPVCSSFLIAVAEAYRQTGNTDIIRSRVKQLAAWENCLLEHSDNYIVNYSYYGDWAAPVVSCMSDESAVSKDTPGILMSTGYSYFNCCLLAEMYGILGDKKTAEKYRKLVIKIRKSFSEKWVTHMTGIVGTGSQACLAFALWLGIIPATTAKKTVKKLNDSIVKNDYKLTCGNLCTRYALEVLFENGFADTAYKVLCSESYPGYGYMLQNEATTVWERFELKKNPGMNSHNHPMYGSVDYCFYRCILGIRYDSSDGSHITVKPCIPSDLSSAEGYTETRFGTISVKWAKRYDRKVLMVNVPVGLTCDIEFYEVKETVTSGTHIYNI